MSLATEPEKPKTSGNRPVKIILGIGVLITLLSIQVPWLSNEFGRSGAFTLTLLDFFQAGTSSLELQDLPFTAVITMIGFLLALVSGVLSLRVRRLATLFGAMNLFTGIIWILGLDSIPSRFISQLGGQGVALAIPISAGLGPYLVIGIGVVVLIGYYVTREQ